MNKTFLVLFFVVFAFSAAAQQSVAFLGVTNRSRTANSDYLAGIIEGVLLFDLSKTQGLSLVERRDLDQIMNEQKLSFSGLSDTDAGSIGKLVQAKTLLLCEYVAGGSLMITARLVDVATSKTRVLTVNGETENTIHELAGLVAGELGAGRVDFTDPDSERSVFTLKDIEPGRIQLYCNLINAEVTLDGRFIGYTPGNLYTPLELPDIDPGVYRLRISLGNDFGVIDLPAVTFRDWEEEVHIRPGRGTIVRARIADFNSQIYKLMKIFRDSLALTSDIPKNGNEESSVYTDRTGLVHQLHFSLSAELSNGKGKAKGVLVVNNEPLPFEATAGKPFKEPFKELSVEIKVTDKPGGYSEVYWNIERCDLYQGMAFDR